VDLVIREFGYLIYKNANGFLLALMEVEINFVKVIETYSRNRDY
jgi:hypothetical protein